MAFRILGTSIISDSRELLGVGTAGITTALYVGENIEMDAVSGVVTSAGLDLGTGGVTYTEVSTDLTGIGSAATNLASAEAIVNYVGSQIGDSNNLDFVDKDGNAGEVNIGAGNFFGLLGTDNEVDAVVSAGTTQITFSLASELIAPGSIESTDYVAVGAGLTVGTTLSFGGSEAVDSITETVDGSSTNLQLPTAAAVLAAIGSSVGGDITANSLVVSGISTLQGQVNAEDGIDVTGHTETDTLRVSGLSTFQGNVEFDTGVSFTFADDAQPIDAVGVATDLGGGSPVDTTLPTQRAVKLYVDSQIGAANQLTFSDGTTTGEIDLASETLLFNGGTNISLEVNSAGGNELTVNLDDSIVLTGDVQAGVITATSQLVASGAGIGLTVTNAAYVSGALDVDGAASLNAGAAIAGANLTLGTDVDLVGDGATSEISGITTANLGAGVVATNFYGSGEFLTDISAGDITATPELTGSTPRSIAFLDAPTGTATILTDLSELNYVPDTGTLNATNFNTLSDIRYKENVETIEGALGKVDSLRGVTYNWKSNGHASVGVIAQEVQAVLPELISEGEEKITVNYNGLVGLLLQAVKELSAEVEELKKAQ